MSSSAIGNKPSAADSKEPRAAGSNAAACNSDTDPVVKVVGREGETADTTLHRLGFEGSGRTIMSMVSKAKADKIATLPGGMAGGYGDLFDDSYHMMAGCTPVYDRFYYEAVARQEKWLSERRAASAEENSKKIDDQDEGSRGQAAGTCSEP